MNTSQIKRFAQDARTKLMGLVGGKLDSVLNEDNAALRTKAETLRQLNEDVKAFGKEAVIDKVAYTWFNRLVALRFMDANDFQPLGINILSPAQGVLAGSSQILSDIQAGIFPAELKLDGGYVNDVLNGVIPSANPDNEIFRHVLIAVCNDLHRLFPFLFEPIDDYSELLLPDDLTSPFSIVADVVNGMSVEDCVEVEIIGWLYQFYISERKDEVFASKSKVKKEDIPAATQLFTPRWIVEYMVQNTLGKLWLQNRPQSRLKEVMPYYIDSPVAQSADFLKVDAVEDIRLCDQACGSGHILVYAFELLTKIYEEEGYAASEIPAKIIQHNLFGLEIDERAAQLASFAVVMKARQYHRRFFRKIAVPKVLCFEDVLLTDAELKKAMELLEQCDNKALGRDLQLLANATNFGSLIQPESPARVLEAAQNKLNALLPSADLFDRELLSRVQKGLKQLAVLARKYHCVVDNPPYMGSGNMNAALSEFVRQNYILSKADLMATFMEAGLQALLSNGFLGMINQHSWMFLSSYEGLREKLIEDKQFDTLLHLGPRTFPEIGGEVVQNAAFTFRNVKPEQEAVFIRLVDFNSSAEKKEKTLEAIQNQNCSWLYTKNQKEFEKIPGNNIGYWLCESYLDAFVKGSYIENYLTPSNGVQTGNNERFTRRWSEIEFHKLNNKWFPYSKGGTFRKWYGNIDLLVNWEFDGAEIQMMNNSCARGKHYYFTEGITWSDISTGGISFRLLPRGCLFDAKGPSAFGSNHIGLIGFLNSKIVSQISEVLNPTLSFQIGEFKKIPVLRFTNIVNIFSENLILKSKMEWNSRETSWDFQQNELLRLKGNNFSESVANYKAFWREQFFQLHQNEEELNRQFIEIYGLEDELTPDVPLEGITLLKDEAKIINNELVFQEDEFIKQLLSYAVGCIFGRYSLEKEGLILANQGENLENYLQKVDKEQEELQFIPDSDNVMTFLDEEWFDDDIVSRTKEFVRIAWGAETYTENIRYVEETLGKPLRTYFLRDFYKDHIRRYKKRPIYWMFSSPKGHFNVLIYIHRYTPDTLNIVLNSYLRPFMEKVRNEINRQSDIIISGSAVEQGRARRRVQQLQDVLEDCEEYEHDILYPMAGDRITIDLDDGVLVNYNKFGDAIEPVPGLNDAKTKKKVKGFDWIDTSTIR